MTVEPWLHLAHILGAVIWLGGGLMLSVFAARARQSGDPGFIRQFARMLSYAGLRLFTPAVVVVLASGVWLVLASAEWSFTQLWVLLALGAFAAAFLIGALYLSRSAIQLERLTAAADFDLQAARELLSRWIMGYQAVLVILLIAVWDMVFKPGV